MKMLGSGASLAFIFAACGDSTEEALIAAELAERCSIDSDCVDPYICAFARCHEECQADRDCDKYGARCVRAPTGVGVCQLQIEMSCKTRDCQGNQVCSPEDQQCRDRCGPNQGCIAELVCANSGVCASTNEVDSAGNVLQSGAGGTSPGTAGTGPTSGGGGETAGGGNQGNGSVSGAGVGGSIAGASGNSAGTSGFSGNAGSSAGNGGGGSVLEEKEGNNSIDEAMHIEPGISMSASFANASDADYYELITPADNAAGGYYEFSITDIPDGQMSVAVYSEIDKGEILTFNTATTGMSRFAYWSAAAGETYFIAVRAKAGTKYPYAYKLNVTYSPASDALEPNDTRVTAKPLTAGVTAHGLIFTGFRGSEIAALEYEDWFSVDLANGPVNAQLKTVPASANARITLFNADGNELGNPASSPTLGADVKFGPYNITVPGKYYFQVTAYNLPAAKGTMIRPAEVPRHLMDAYSFTVTQ